MECAHDRIRQWRVTFARLVPASSTRPPSAGQPPQAFACVRAGQPRRPRCSLRLCAGGAPEGPWRRPPAPRQASGRRGVPSRRRRERGLRRRRRRRRAGGGGRRGVGGSEEAAAARPVRAAAVPADPRRQRSTHALPPPLPSCHSLLRLMCFALCASPYCADSVRPCLPSSLPACLPSSRLPVWLSPYFCLPRFPVALSPARARSGDGAGRADFGRERRV